MKEASMRKVITKQSKDLKQPSHGALKSSLISTKKSHNRESHVPRGLHKYTELPSLRYGITPNQTAFYSRKSGPLRLNFGCENNHWRTQKMCNDTVNGDSIAVVDQEPNFKGNGLANFNGDAPSVRRVRFAEMPSKSTCFLEFTDLSERSRDHRERNREEKRESENCLKNRISFSCADEHTAVSSSRFGRDGLSSSVNFSSAVRVVSDLGPGTNGDGNAKEPAKNHHQFRSTLKKVIRGHNTAKYHQESAALAQVPQTDPLPVILKAAKDGDEDEVAEALRKASLFGISPEELNATDASGRTAVSYIASNGNLKNLKTILKLPKLDVNKQDNEGNTPLHFASQAGQVEVINYMLSVCPDLETDARNAVGLTPLMKAALQGRTKCAKLLLFAGASPDLKDSGRGLKAEEWAKYCGRHGCAEVIEKFSKQKHLGKNASLGKWESEPELLRINNARKPQLVPSSTSSNIKLKLRKAFRTTSHPGSDSSAKPYTVVSHLTTVALCASSPVLQSSVSPSIKSLIRPLSVPKVEVTLASNHNKDYADSSLQHSFSVVSTKEKCGSGILSNRFIKKK